MNRLLSRSNRMRNLPQMQKLFRNFASSSKQPPSPSESFLRPASGPYVEQMYTEWKQNPKSVHSSWDAYFKNVASGASPQEAFQAPPTLRAPGQLSSYTPSASIATSDIQKEITDHLKVQLLVRAYQVRGHHIAKLDPLGILNPDLSGDIPKELLLETYGFTEKDLDRKFHVGTVGQMTGILGNDDTMTLGEIISKLKSIYCGSLGFEYMHINSREECNWVRERVEKLPVFKFSNEEKKVILDRLLWADLFENFVAKKWKSEKRFGLEGCEALIPGIKSLIDLSADLGTRNIVIGMPHRGRLNVLANVVRKPLEAIFSEFSGTTDTSDSFSGDVKYHLGMNFDRPTRNGKRIHLSLVANPSHLEAVNPVVMGKCRGMQYFTNDEERINTVPVLLHGDAAFAGQGVVYESMGMINLPNYTTGGVVHLIVNNQIGFTTDPRFSRSTPYCSDIAKSFQAPVFHVNADDPEAVVYVCNLAMEYRNTFKKDAIVDIICYRKHGHNEIDQPAFTQPLMYKKIESHENVLSQYVRKLTSEGAVTSEEVDKMKNEVNSILEKCYEQSKTYKHTLHGWTSSTWMTENKLPTLEQLSKTVAKIQDTGVPMDVLKSVGKSVSTYPENFNINPGLGKIYKAKEKTIEEGKGIDMPTAEALAFGTLLQEGIHIRLSGQDVERGTFSQRHALIHDQVNESKYIPLNNLNVNGTTQKEKIVICNSHLSEYAVMGFELGYSLVNPYSLTIWEAQFGDFANTAQTIIDQFIASGEKKWLQRTGLVLLLPHGYDGAGPEHSSGRLERFLQLCDDHPDRIPKMSVDERRQIQDGNLQVVYPTTPANYFHLLRRQIHRDFRKPLVVFTSKSLLRHPLARSSLEEMGEGTRFHRFIPNPIMPNPLEVKRLVLCSGQVYNTLYQARDEQKLNDSVAISRVEQISPFPFDRVAEEASKYPNAQIVWAQEEPMNAGAWTYVQPRLTAALKTTQYHSRADIFYAGREPSASTATGNKKQHIQEEKDIISLALHGKHAPKTKK